MGSKTWTSYDTMAATILRHDSKSPSTAKHPGQAHTTIKSEDGKMLQKTSAKLPFLLDVLIRDNGLDLLSRFASSSRSSLSLVLSFFNLVLSFTHLGLLLWHSVSSHLVLSLLHLALSLSVHCAACSVYCATCSVHCATFSLPAYVHHPIHFGLA